MQDWQTDARTALLFTEKDEEKHENIDRQSLELN